MFGLGITHYGLQELAEGRVSVTLVRRTPAVMCLPREATLEIPASYDRLEQWFNTDRSTRQLIQDAFPDLSPDHREFLTSGLTPDEWNRIFGKVEV